MIRKTAVAILALAGTVFAQEKPVQITCEECAKQLFQALSGDMPRLAADKQVEFQRKLLELTGANADLEDEKPRTLVSSTLISKGTKAAVLTINAFDQFDDKALNDLRDMVKEGKANCLVINLINASGDTLEAGEAFVKAIDAIKVPKGVLIDSRTNAVAEIVADSMQKAGYVLLGEDSSGYPAPRRHVKLDSGAVLKIHTQTKGPALKPSIPLSFSASKSAWSRIAADTLTVLALEK